MDSRVSCSDRATGLEPTPANGSFFKTLDPVRDCSDLTRTSATKLPCRESNSHQLIRIECVAIGDVSGFVAPTKPTHALSGRSVRKGIGHDIVAGFALQSVVADGCMP